MNHFPNHIFRLWGMCVLPFWGQSGCEMTTRLYVLISLALPFGSKAIMGTCDHTIYRIKDLRLANTPSIAAEAGHTPKAHWCHWHLCRIGLGWVSKGAKNQAAWWEGSLASSSQDKWALGARRETPAGTRHEPGKGPLTRRGHLFSLFNMIHLSDDLERLLGLPAPTGWLCD